MEKQSFDDRLLRRKQKQRWDGASLGFADHRRYGHDTHVTGPFVHIVDDDPFFRSETTRLLQASGFAVKTFSTAIDFLARLDPNASGCVLTDLRMPEMNGLDLQSILTQTHNPMPIIFMTCDGDIPSTEFAMRNGRDDFLERRATGARLIEAVRRAFARDLRERESFARKGSQSSRVEASLDFLFERLWW